MSFLVSTQCIPSTLTQLFETTQSLGESRKFPWSLMTTGWQRKFSLTKPISVNSLYPSSKLTMHSQIPKRNSTLLRHYKQSTTKRQILRKLSSHAPILMVKSKQSYSLYSRHMSSSFLVAATNGKATQAPSRWWKEANLFGPSPTQYHSRIIRLSEKKYIDNATVEHFVNSQQRRLKPMNGHHHVLESQRRTAPSDLSLIFDISKYLNDKSFHYPWLMKS